MKTVIHKSWIGSDPRPPRWDKIPTELLPKICFEAPLIIMVKIARTGFSTSNGHNFQTKKRYRISENSRLFEGFHPLFHESVLTSLFHPLSGSFSRKSDKKGVPCVAHCGSVAQNMPLGPPDQEKEKKITATSLLLLVAVTFVNLIFRIFG